MPCRRSRAPRERRPPAGGNGRPPRCRHRGLPGRGASRADGRPGRADRAGRRRAAARVPTHPEPAGGRSGRRAARLGELLTGPALRVRARELPARLDSDGRDLRGTLRAWISAGGNAERAAQLLGVHAQTVREHVRSAEPVLERRLLAAGSDLYEVVPAHVAAGDLRRPDLRGPAHRAESGHPDSPVHD